MSTVMVALAPLARSPVSQAPLSAAEVWVTASLLVKVNLSPALIVVVAGANAKLAIDTVGAADAALPVPGCTTILRGPLPTGIVATTFLAARSTTETFPEFSFVTYARAAL